MFNPYRHLQTKIRSLLVSEAKMSAEERRANSWMLQIACAGTKFTVGKGDVNTMFYQFGDDERKANYPDWVLEHLDALGSQKFTRYEVIDTDGNVKNFWSLARIRRKFTPKAGMRVVGIRGLDHELERELVLIVNRDKEGAPAWHDAKGTKQFARFQKEQAALVKKADDEADDEE